MPGKARDKIMTEQFSATYWNHEGPGHDGATVTNQDGVTRAIISQHRGGYHPGGNVHVEGSGWMIAFRNGRGKVCLSLPVAATGGSYQHYIVGGTRAQAVEFAIRSYDEAISYEEYRSTNMKAPIGVTPANG